MHTLPRILALVCILFCSCLATAQVAVCQSQINVALNPDACTIDLEWSWLDAGSYVPSGMTIGYSLENHTDLAPGTYTIVMTVGAYTSGGTLAGQTSCWTTVIVEDKFAPELTCLNATYYLVDPDQDYFITADDVVTATDNCEVATRIYNFVEVSPGFGVTTFEAEATDAAGNLANCSGTVTLADAEPQNYCSSVRNAGYEHISSIQLRAATNTVTENSGNDGGYRQHLPTGDNILYHGSEYTIDYAPGFPGSTYHEYWSIYLDKNLDGDFTDAGELIHQWNGYGGNSFTFTSPGTEWGWSRIRVVMSYGNYAGPCGGGWGETEDISVYLRPYLTIIWPWFRPEGDDESSLAAASSLNGLESRSERSEQAAAPGELRRRPVDFMAARSSEVEAQVSVYPNPARAGEQVTVSGLSLSEGTPLELRTVTGKLMARFPVTAVSQRIDLPGGLPAGMYLLGRSGGDWRERVVVR